jgi:putative FmdB family regulatory protein
MPIYEYRCRDCGRKARLFFTYSQYGTATPVCPHCQSASLKRLIGRIAIAKSEDTRLDSLADDSALAGLDEEDPRSLGRFMRKMSGEMGEDLGDEFNEVVNRLESGESPDSIEESMPELGGDAGSFGGDDDFM